MFSGQLLISSMSENDESSHAKIESKSRRLSSTPKDNSNSPGMGKICRAVIFWCFHLPKSLFILFLFLYIALDKSHSDQNLVFKFINRILLGLQLLNSAVIKFLV